MIVAVTQRIEIEADYNERRDALDQQWTEFLYQAEIIPLILPNRVEIVRTMLRMIPIGGILLTGGNDLAKYGGNAPERDEVEDFLLQYSRNHKIPLLGVCRGMQFIQDRFGIVLEKVPGHVVSEQRITHNGQREMVNSYHRFGAFRPNAELLTTALAEDGVVEACKHIELPIRGIMWHPERFSPFREEDLQFFKNYYLGDEMVHAVILAAGKGSRMKDLTADKPKCFVKAGEKRLIDWQLDALQRSGIPKNNISIVTGYMGDQIQALGYKTFLNPAWSSSNMVRSLLCADEILSEHCCILSYSDIIYDDRAAADLMNAPGDLVVAYHAGWRKVWEARFKNPLEDAETFQKDASGALIDIGRRTDDINEIMGQYVGLLKITPKGWKIVKEGCLAMLDSHELDRLDMTSMLHRILDMKLLTIATLEISGVCLEADSESDIELYNSWFLNGRFRVPH